MRKSTLSNGRIVSCRKYSLHNKRSNCRGGRRQKDHGEKYEMSYCLLYGKVATCNFEVGTLSFGVATMRGKRKRKNNASLVAAF